MSFKDVRDLAEHLKLLGFPRIFPLQSLCCKYGSLGSFCVVAEILQWLVGLLEPGTVIAGGSETESERIILIRSATEFFVTKSAIKLNPRKLYASSYATAGELQKITRLLISSPQDGDETNDDDNYRSLNQVDIGDKMEDLRRARELSADLASRGAALYDLLSNEMVNKNTRIAQANRPMELASVERAMKNAIAAAQVKLQSSKAQLENSRVEMNALNSKLQRKKAELERTKQRLEALQKIRPAHMQEFEECEHELQQLFQQYFQRIHIRDALKAQLGARTKRSSPVGSPILQKPAESSMPFIPEGLIEDDEDDDGIGAGISFDEHIPDIRDEDAILRDIDIDNDRLRGRKSSSVRPGTATSRVRPTTGRRQKPAIGNTIGRHKVAGKIYGDTEDDDDDSTFGSSESDLDIGEGAVLGISTMGDAIAGGGEDESELNTDEDFSISKITGGLPLRPKTANKPEHHSDEDF